MNPWLLPFPISIVGFALSTGPAAAHDVWKNGDPVPAWVKAACCGPDDAHMVDPSAVTEDDQGYVFTVDGHVFHIARKDTLPSQDGQFWIFFSPHQTDPYVYCAFIPMSG